MLKSWTFRTEKIPGPHFDWYRSNRSAKSTEDACADHYATQVSTSFHIHPVVLAGHRLTRETPEGTVLLALSYNMKQAHILRYCFISSSVPAWQHCNRVTENNKHLIDDDDDNGIEKTNQQQRTQGQKQSFTKDKRVTCFPYSQHCSYWEVGTQP